MKKPRLIKINDRVQLCLVSYLKGEIVDIDGPVMCVADPGINGEDFVGKLVEMLGEAVTVSKVLELDDLPQDIKENIEAQIAEIQSSSEKPSSSSESSSSSE